MSERIPTRKMWDHIIDMKKEFILRKRKIHILSIEEKEEMCKFINKQLRKEYIRLLKLSQIIPVLFVRKKDGKKTIV